MIRKLGLIGISLFIGFLLSQSLPLCLQPAEAGAGDQFQPVKERLVQSGLERWLVEQAFEPPLDLKLDTVALALRIREGRLNYQQYLQPWALKKAERFLQRHETLFDQVESRFSVNRQTITAILLIETRIGGYTGTTPVLDILATLSLMDRPEYQDRIWSMLSPEDRKEYGRAAIDRRLDSRAERARKDLRALLDWYRDRPGQLTSLKGSIMGAVGWPQFLPDNVEPYGVDGDNDGRIDLFDPADAIFSVAKYLRAAGWRSDRPQAKERAILRYNRSRPYMRTVMQIAETLKTS